MLSNVHRFHGLHALDYAHRHGRVIRSGPMSLKYIRNNRSISFRVAVVVSKKVSKSAVVRNRIRRRVYEVARLQTNQLQQPYDLVFMVYAIDIATMPSDQLQAIITTQLSKAGVI